MVAVLAIVVVEMVVFHSVVHLHLWDFGGEKVGGLEEVEVVMVTPLRIQTQTLVLFSLFQFWMLGNS